MSEPNSTGNLQCRTAGIILAAGLSRRMGDFKPLLPINGVPMIVHVADVPRAAGVDPVLVITGHRASEVAAALSDRALPLVHNERFAEGEMLSSIQAGVRALPADIDAFLLALGDQPGLLPDTIHGLIDAWRQSRPPLVVPTFDGRRGHPLLISAKCANDILSLDARQTLRDFVEQHKENISYVPVADPAILLDVDTPEDYRNALRRAALGRAGGQTDWRR
jgi:molybdenum cofactor cytidylyltransferase